VLDQRLDTAERLAESEQPGSPADLDRFASADAHPERRHPAETAHLFHGHVVRWMSRLARVEHLADRRMLSQEAWWEPVLDGVMLHSRHDLLAAPLAPSRLLPVHPGWQRWRPPRTSVH
jgi:hypothetical protein